MERENMIARRVGLVCAATCATAMFVLAPASAEAQTACAPDSENFVPAVCGHVFTDQTGGTPHTYDSGEGVEGVKVVVSLNGQEYNSTGLLECVGTDCGYYSFNTFDPGTYTFCVIATDSDPVCKEVIVDTPSETADLEIGVSTGGSDVSSDDTVWGVGTGTPGYWKNHPEAWPVEKIVIGDTPGFQSTYTKAQAITYLASKVSGDKTITIFASLVSAILNTNLANNTSCIAPYIADAQHWFSIYGPVGVGVKAKSDAWVGGPLNTFKAGEPIHQKMDEYNNGLLCAPHRD
jgi:hypothetical protein